MRIVRKSKKKVKKKERLEEPNKQYNLWQTRSKKFSKYPYIITVSFFRRNFFLTASDLRGRIKLWTNSGRFGFKGRYKKDFMVIMTVADKFFKRLKKYGIKYVFLKFKNFRRSRHAIRKVLQKHRKYSKPYLRFIGIWTEMHVSFNGCRKKKLRRKRFRRRTKRIWIQ